MLEFDIVSILCWTAVALWSIVLVIRIAIFIHDIVSGSLGKETK